MLTRLGVGGPSAAFPEFQSKEMPFAGEIIDVVGFYEPEMNVTGLYELEIDVVGTFED